MSIRFHFQRLQSRLIVWILMLSLGPLALAMFFTVRQSEAELIRQAGSAMATHAENAMDRIDRNLAERYGDAQAFAFNEKAHEGRSELEAAANFAVKAYPVYDLMLVADRDGRILAANTVDHEGRGLDTARLIGRSVRGEPWFEKVISGEIRAGQSFAGELAPDRWAAEVYGNRGDAIVFAAPVVDEHGNVVRVWSTRASPERIVRQVLRSLRDSLAQQGFEGVETQLLSKTGAVLDDSDLGAIFQLNLVERGLSAAREAVAGRRGFTRETHLRRGIEQVNGYAASRGAPGYAGHGWSVLVRQDSTTALAAVTALHHTALVVAALAAGLTIAAAIWISRGIVRPLQRTVGVMQSVASGRLTEQVEVSSADEVGQMGRAVNEAVRGMRESVVGVSRSSQALASTAEEFSAVSQTMGANAEETATQANVVSAATEQVNRSVQTVAASVEEMNASIKEIARHATEAARVAEEGVQSAAVVNASVSKLDASSQEIEKVVDVITSIAQQTNLLALNATIEAARAGEAGKGFAVVANEVKELARGTTRATAEIGQMIATIQTDARGAVESIGRIGDVISRISDLQNTIAGAVEEQTATTGEIARSVTEAARGTAEIADNITSVAQAARSTSEGAADTQKAADQLSEMASELQSLVGRFEV